MMPHSQEVVGMTHDKCESFSIYLSSVASIYVNKTLRAGIGAAVGQHRVTVLLSADFPSHFARFLNILIDDFDSSSRQVLF